MDMNEDLQEFSLDDIMKEFSSAEADPAPEEKVETEDLSALFQASELPVPAAPEPAEPAAEAPVQAAAGEEPKAQENQQEAAEEPAQQEPENLEDTKQWPAPAKDSGDETPVAVKSDAPAAKIATGDETLVALPPVPVIPEKPLTEEEAAAPVAEPESEPVQEKHVDHMARLKELKKKLIAGPEKLYYELSEQGILRLQIGIIVNLIILAVCIAATTMFALDKVPENRMKLLIFSQVLAMLLSGLLGCHLMLDGLGEIFHGKFSVNTILGISFLACLADAYFCLNELRVPCCAAFTLEMIMAMLARYQRRSTEMSQLDTMRKAVRLTSIVKQPDYYEGRNGILRGQGDVEDFMDTYTATTGPQKFQNAFVLFCFILCIGIAAVAGMLHSVSMAVQIFATSLLVAVPASAFVTLTRPAAVLEKRLHMVGTVICGWQGVKKLCGKAVFPLTDEDLFPKGSSKLNGVKFYSDRNPDEVVAYTASLISVAGGGLVSVFRNLLASRNGQLLPVKNFRDYGGGGIGGEIFGEPVLVGSMNFLQDMGVEIPKGTMVDQAVYAAIDGQLCAVVAISYAKMRSAAAGLVSLCGCRRIKPVLLAGDFMLTEDFIRSKFNVSTRKVVMPDKETRAALSKIKADPEADVLALSTRTDLVSAAYAVTGASALRTSMRLGVFVHVLGGILGVLIMLALAYLGNAELLTPTNVLLYQLIWLVPGFLASEWTRVV